MILYFNLRHVKRSPKHHYGVFYNGCRVGTAWFGSKWHLRFKYIREVTLHELDIFFKFLKILEDHYPKGPKGFKNVLVRVPTDNRYYDWREIRS